MTAVEPSRGTGGKVRKPPSRNPRATPYARPEHNRSLTAGGGGGWLSKLVDPARRLISSGAARVLPSLFLGSPSSASLPNLSDDDDEDQDKLRREGDEDVTEDHHEGISNLGFLRSREVGNAVASDAPKESSSFHGYRKDSMTDPETNLPNDSSFCEIEQLIKGKSFSRAESSRLTEILKSRTVNLSHIKEQEKKLESITLGEGKVQAVPEVLGKTFEVGQECLRIAPWEVSTPLHESKTLSIIPDEIGASPVDIARAYMSSRSEVGSLLKSKQPEDHRELLHVNGHLQKPFLPSPLPKSSICWPGSVVQDQYFTPKTQRGRYGSQNFHWTPYSRNVHSMSKSKVSFRDNELDSGYGSVGPIRSSRQKFIDRSPRTFRNLPSAGPSQRDVDLHTSSFPALKKNVEVGGKSDALKIHSVESKVQNFEIGVPSVPTHSSQMAKKILEHLDRNLPTPKDKAIELKQASSWKKSESSNIGNVMPSHDGNPLHSVDAVKSGRSDRSNWMSSTHANGSAGNLLFRDSVEENAEKTTDVVKRRTSTSNENANNAFPVPGVKTGFSRDSGDVGKSVLKNINKEITEEVPSEADACRNDIPKKPPSGHKAILPSISVDKPQLRAAFSSDSNSGFTFPISASPGMFPEPPTPSIMPPPSLVNSLHQPTEDSAIPSYTFGSKRSSPALVFSFPSTSNATTFTDGSDLKFTFGSEKRRISFSSIESLL